MQFLSQQVFNERAQVAATTTPIRKKLTFSELSIVGADRIMVDGQSIQITEAGFKSLLGRLRIPPAFAKRFGDAWGEDGLKQLLEMVKAGRLGKTDLEVTLLADPTTRKVVDFLPSTAAHISNQSFVEFATRIIDQWGLNPTHFGTDPLGGVQINTLHDSHVFKIPGLTDETFRAGVSFSNTPQRGLEVVPFTERTICANGMIIRLADDTFQLNQLTPDKINEFNERMSDAAHLGFQSPSLIEKIRRANVTTASLLEVNHAAMTILNSNKGMSWDRVNRYIPVDRINQAYSTRGVETEELSKAQKRIANSGMTVWDVCNGLTNFASNDQTQMTDWSRMQVMGGAGNLLKKAFFDREAVIGVDPFGGDRILTNRQAAIARGE
jgi:hypothetical protein